MELKLFEAFLFFCRHFILTPSADVVVVKAHTHPKDTDCDHHTALMLNGINQYDIDGSQCNVVSFPPNRCIFVNDHLDVNRLYLYFVKPHRKSFKRSPIVEYIIQPFFV